MSLVIITLTHVEQDTLHKLELVHDKIQEH